MLLGCKSSFQNIESHWDDKWDVSKCCEGGQNEPQKINEMKSVVDISSRQTKAQCNHKGFEMTKDSIERLAPQQQHTHTPQ